MDAVLLDTSVVSLLHPKKKGNPLRARYEGHMSGKVLALSFQSVAELWSWAEENGWGEKQRAGCGNLSSSPLISSWQGLGFG